MPAQLPHQARGIEKLVSSSLEPHYICERCCYGHSSYGSYGNCGNYGSWVDAEDGHGKGVDKNIKKKNEANAEDDTKNDDEKDCKRIQIFIKTISNRTLTLRVKEDDTILKIKKIINEREGSQHHYKD